MTRAKERLYITGADKSLKKRLAAPLAPVRNGQLLPWAVRSATCFLDWLLDAFCHHPEFDKDLLQGADPELFPEEGSLKVEVPQTDAAEEGEALEKAEEETAPEPDPAVLSRMEKALAFVYPHGADVRTPSKLSVSELTHKAAGEAFLFARRPMALSAQRLTPAERGIAAHKFLQFADFSKAAEDLEEEVSRLGRLGFITKEEAKELDRKTIRSFLEGPLGKRILSADAVHREIRFLKEFTPGELAEVDPALEIGGSTVIQGVADCILVEQGRGTIVDYKTDRVKTPEELIERYRVQLLLYKKILEEYLSLPIEGMLLYSFALSREIQVL